TVNISGEEQVEDISPNTLEAAKTLSRVASQKPKSIEEEAKQVHLDSLLAQRIAEEEELNEQQKKRRAQVQFEAQHYTYEDWDLIRVKIEANAELSKSVLGSGLQGEDFAKKMVELKLSQLKNLSFEEVKEEFDKLVKQVESFAPINFEATKDSLKRFGEELQTKTSKRLKSDEAKDDDPISGTNIPINHVLVAIKPPSIATYKIIKQGEKGVYQIVREDGTDIVYINFGAMLKDITRDDLTELYRIVMNRYGVNGPEDELEKVLWGYLKNMFEEPLSTDPIWSLLAMLDKKLQGGKPDEDCYKLLKWMEKVMEMRRATLGGGAKGLTSPEQTATVDHGHVPFWWPKDSLLQSKWLTGKETSNLFKIQDQGPTSGIRANRGTLNKKNHKITNKHSPIILILTKCLNLLMMILTQPHDDERTNHEDASDTDRKVENAPKQKQQVMISNNLLSQISKLHSEEESKMIMGYRKEGGIPRVKLTMKFGRKVRKGIRQIPTITFSVGSFMVLEVSTEDAQSKVSQYLLPPSMIAMIAIRMKKFYKKTRRRVRVDGKTPIGFDKKKLECFNCHNTGHFAREWVGGIDNGSYTTEIEFGLRDSSTEEHGNRCIFDIVFTWSHDRFQMTNQILLKGPNINNKVQFRYEDTYSCKRFCLLTAKATSDSSKLRHRSSSWNRTVAIEFKNRNMLEFCGNKGIKQEYSNARTPQQNGVAERMNRTLIEAARTMLANSLLPTTFLCKAD
ncbi:putative ribonuclease H-like domain-containing protein, partial [Tanacetum coccineum]